MSRNTRKNQVTGLVTLRHRSIMSGALTPEGGDHVPDTRLDASDAVKLAEVLQAPPSGWSTTLTGSAPRWLSSWARPAYGTAKLRQDR